MWLSSMSGTAVTPSHFVTVQKAVHLLAGSRGRHFPKYRPANTNPGYNGFATLMDKLKARWEEKTRGRQEYRL